MFRPIQAFSLHERCTRCPCPRPPTQTVILGLPNCCAWGLRHLVGVCRASCTAPWPLFLVPFYLARVTAVLHVPCYPAPLWNHRLPVPRIAPNSEVRHLVQHLNASEKWQHGSYQDNPWADWGDGQKGACIGEPDVACFGCIETVTCFGSHSCRRFRPHEKARIQRQLERDCIEHIEPQTMVPPPPFV